MTNSEINIIFRRICKLVYLLEGSGERDQGTDTFEEDHTLGIRGLREIRVHGAKQ